MEMAFGNLKVKKVKCQMIKQIISKEEKEKKQRRNSMIIGIILIAIMIFSTAGYAFFGRENKNTNQIEYNKIKFYLLDDGWWHFSLNNEEYATAYNPKNVENISFFLTLNSYSYENKPLYFSYDSEREGMNEISRNIGKFAERIQYACMENCTEDYPIKDCKENIIIIKEANESLIKQEDNCVYIFSNDLRAEAAFIFRIL